MRTALVALLVLALAAPAPAVVVRGYFNNFGKVRLKVREFDGAFIGRWRCRGYGCPVKNGRVGFSCLFGYIHIGQVTTKKGHVCEWLGECRPLSLGVISAEFVCESLHVGGYLDLE